MAIFFNIVFNLPFVSIACFSQNISDASEYFGIRQDFLGIVNEKYIKSAALRQNMLEPSVAFPYPSFQEIASDSPSEQFFAHGNHDSVHILPVLPADAVFETAGDSESAF